MRTLKPEHLEDDPITFSSFRASWWRKLGQEQQRLETLATQARRFFENKRFSRLVRVIVMEQVMNGYRSFIILRSGEGLTSLMTNNRANFSGAKKRTVKPSRVYIFRTYAKKNWVACITGALWAKQGERGSLSEARDDSRSSRASRKMPRSPCLAHKAPVMQANFVINLFLAVPHCARIRKRYLK